MRSRSAVHRQSCCVVRAFGPSTRSFRWWHYVTPSTMLSADMSHLCRAPITCAQTSPEGHRFDRAFREVRGLNAGVHAACRVVSSLNQRRGRGQRLRGFRSNPSESRRAHAPSGNDLAAKRDWLVMQSKSQTTPTARQAGRIASASLIGSMQKPQSRLRSQPASE